jgi:tRNA(Phe) wybutosine-synthesizing methylase Tyw3
MAIEIKELIIKFSVEEGQRVLTSSKVETVLSKEQMKAIIDQCKEEVWEKFSRLTER